MGEEIPNTTSFESWSIFLSFLSRSPSVLPFSYSHLSNLQIRISSNICLFHNDLGNQPQLEKKKNHHVWQVGTTILAVSNLSRPLLVVRFWSMHMLSFSEMILLNPSPHTSHPPYSLFLTTFFSNVCISQKP